MRPPLTTRFERITVPLVMLNTRPRLLPLTVRLAGAGPLMAMLLPITSSPLVSVIVPATESVPVRKALQLVVDGTEPDQIRSIMEVELSSREHADHSGAKVFEGMGIYSPTLGIIGAVLGLMAVMQNLADPAKLGAGIAAAFTATVYGIGLANLFLLPIASKLRTTVQAQSHVREMVIEGMVAIAQGDNPRSIESRLQGYLH